MRSTSFVLAASLALASLETISAASSLTTSLDNNAALLRTRQAKTKDVARRIRNGSRRRAEPSSVGSCYEALNTEKVVNGDFSSSHKGDLSPWSFSGEGDHYGDLLTVSCTTEPGGKCTSLIARVGTGKGTFTLSQPVTTCPGLYYVAQYTIGSNRDGYPCTVSISIGDGTAANTRTVRVDTNYCNDGCDSGINANGYYTSSGRLGKFTAVAGDSVLAYSITCRPPDTFTGNQAFEFDDLSLMRIDEE